MYVINSHRKSHDVNLFIFTINTTSGTGNSFDLPLRSGYNYDFIVDWGDGQTSEITSFDDVDKTHTYATGGEYQIKISGLCEAWYFNNGGDKLKLISIDQWGNTGFVTMEHAFYGCSNLTAVNDTDGTWCSSVTNMRSMFYICPSLVTLDASNWDVSKVTNMYGMFASCLSLEILDISNWNVSKVTNMYFMFRMCDSLTTLNATNWDVSNVTNMYYMFSSCESLTELYLNNWDVSSVTNMVGMFRGCMSLETLSVSNWDVSSVTNMAGMFDYCNSLTTINVTNWDVSNVISMIGMFYNCSSLETLDVSKWNVSSVGNMSDMFRNCISLTTINVGNWDVSNVNDMEFMFYNTPIGTTTYDALLIGWSQLPSLKSNVIFDANLAKYSSGEAAMARQYIIDTYGWTIRDDN